MKRRWTIKELKTISNKDLLLALINERKSELTNACAPLNQRLIELEKHVTQTYTVLADCEQDLAAAIAAMPRRYSDSEDEKRCNNLLLRLRTVLEIKP